MKGICNETLIDSYSELTSCEPVSSIAMSFPEAGFDCTYPHAITCSSTQMFPEGFIGGSMKQKSHLGQ